MKTAAAIAVALLALMNGLGPVCSGRLDEAPSYTDVRIEGVPHVRQKPDFCGEACTAMVLGKLGRPGDQDHVFNRSGLSPLRARGAWTKELKVALVDIGFDVGPVWHTVQADEAATEIETLWSELHADLVAGVPSIVCTRFDERPGASEHFRLVLGYDAATDRVIYHDPALDDGAYLQMDRSTFLSIWPLKYSDSEWSVIRLRMDDGELAETEDAADLTAADYAQHMMVVGPSIPTTGFTVTVEPPFLVVSNLPPEELRIALQDTVRPSGEAWVAALDSSPSAITDVWLLEDTASYTHISTTVFAQESPPEGGDYLADRRALCIDMSGPKPGEVMDRLPR